MSTGSMKKEILFCFFRKFLKLFWVEGIFFARLQALDVTKVLKRLTIPFPFVVRALSIRRLYLLLAL